MGSYVRNTSRRVLGILACFLFGGKPLPPSEGPWLALGLALGWPLAWPLAGPWPGPWLALGLAVAGPWPGPWLAQVFP